MPARLQRCRSGVGKAALRRAAGCAATRVVFGRPTGANQGISLPLAEAHARLTAAELGSATRPNTTSALLARARLMRIALVTQQMVLNYVAEPLIGLRRSC